MGRPCIFDRAIFEQIAERVSNGETLKSVCDSDEKFPSAPTVRRWVVEDREGISALYARARECQMEAWADDIVEIADDGRNDWMTIKRGGEDVEVPNQEVLQRSRLRVDTRKWIASKILPKKFGDKVAIGGADDLGPVQLSWKSRSTTPPETKS